MGFYYVRSTTGSDSNIGNSWATAKQTIVGALNVALPGDVIYVSQAHNYITGGSITYPAKGTYSNPVLVVCVNDSAQPPTQVASTASETVISTSNDIAFANSMVIYWYGINFKSARHIYYPYNTVMLPFENCTFQLLSTSQGLWVFQPAGGNSTFNTYCNCQFINSSFIAASTASALYFYNQWNWTYNPNYPLTTGTVPWQTINILSFKGCMFSGVIFTNIIRMDSAWTFINAVFDGCDLSSMSYASSFINNVTNFTPCSKIYLKNCKLNANASLTNVSLQNIQQPDIYLDNCDSSGTNTRNEIYRYHGTVKSSTSVYRTDGASTGATGYSYILETNSYASAYYPVESPAISMWCSTSGTQRTAIVEFVHDSSSQIGSNEIWAELEYQGSSASPIASFTSTKSPTYPLLTSSPTAPPIDTTVTWTTGPLTNPTYQKFQFQFTPQMAGLIVIKVYLAKASYAVYVDPTIILV